MVRGEVHELLVGWLVAEWDEKRAGMVGEVERLALVSYSNEAAQARVVEIAQALKGHELTAGVLLLRQVEEKPTVFFTGTAVARPAPKPMSNTAFVLELVSVTAICVEDLFDASRESRWVPVSPMREHQPTDYIAIHTKAEDLLAFLPSFKVVWLPD